MLAVHEAADGASGNPTPQQVIVAVGKTLRLDACGIFPLRGTDTTPIALHFRTQKLSDAFVLGYEEKTVGLLSAQAIQPTGQPLRLADWAPTAPFPQHIVDLMSPEHWVMALELKNGDELLGLLWMFGSAKPQSKPPSEGIAQMIAHLATQAVQETVGRAWAIRESEELQLLEELGTMLTQKRPLQERLKVVVDRTQEASGFASVTLTVGDPTSERRAAASALALDGASYSDDFYAWATDFFCSREQLIQTFQYHEGRKGPLLFADPAKITETEPIHRAWMVENAITFYATIPLVFGEQTLGVFRIYSGFNEQRTWERLRVFAALASHIAAIIESTMLYDQVQEAHADLSASHHATIRTLAYAAEARDPYTGDHLRHIEAYVRALAPELGLADQETEELTFGAILHDVGKLRVPDTILLKESALDEREWEIIRRHPLYGEEILIHSRIPHVAREITRWHHERWDGGGYPDGMRGDDIPLPVQIVTVADVFDALTSARPYKPAWPPDKALAEILKNSGSQFSPRVAQAFRSLFEAGVVQSILASHANQADDADDKILEGAAA